MYRPIRIPCSGKNPPKNKYQVIWTGKEPRYYLGEWKIKKNGRDVSQFIPTNFRIRPAYTWGEYPVIDTAPFQEIKSYVEDGYNTPEWIQHNLYWLQLIVDDEADYKTLYDMFHEKDFRTSRYL